MGDIDLDQIEAGLKGLVNIDWKGMLKAFQNGDIDGEIVAAEQVAGLAAIFVPDAMYVKDALAVLLFINKTREEGLWAPADPSTPSMARSAGNTGQGTPQMHGGPIVQPGGTPDDPDGFDSEPAARVV